MGSSFTKLERQAIRQTFQDHSQDDLHNKTQSDEVNCGIWVIWIGWLWLSPEAKATNNFKILVERTMHTEHHIHNLLHNDTPAKSRMNLAYALKIRRTLRLSLNPNLPEADATHHSTLRDRVVDTYYREPAIEPTENNASSHNRTSQRTPRQTSRTQHTQLAPMFDEQHRRDIARGKRKMTEPTPRAQDSARISLPDRTPHPKPGDPSTSASTYRTDDTPPPAKPINTQRTKELHVLSEKITPGSQRLYPPLQREPRTDAHPAQNPHHSLNSTIRSRQSTTVLSQPCNNKSPSQARKNVTTTICERNLES